MTEAALFYEAAKRGLGDLFLDDIQRAIDTVRERPHLGIVVSYGFRRALVRRFPFSLVYALEGEPLNSIVRHHVRAVTTSPITAEMKSESGG